MEAERSSLRPPLQHLRACRLRQAAFHFGSRWLVVHVIHQRVIARAVASKQQRQSAGQCPDDTRH
eukprot:2036811-Pleurochrysis_carterae.AAC.2